MTSLKKKIFVAAALPVILLCLCFAGLPGTAGTASADLKLDNSKDDQKVKDFCSSHLGSNASRFDKGACYEGYVLGINNSGDGACDKDFNNKPSAIHACKTVGYNGGVHNLANITKPSGGGGGGGGAAAGGTADQCGGGDGVKTSINIGCRGKGNPIADMAFAVIRILSAGVGLVVVGSIIVGGIQYSASRGDPQATALAINRIRSSLFALLLFIFGYALLNYVIPGQFLQ